MPLAEARRYPATGGTVEEVLALRPDVVVTGSFLDVRPPRRPSPGLACVSKRSGSPRRLPKARRKCGVAGGGWRALRRAAKRWFRASRAASRPRAARDRRCPRWCGRKAGSSPARRRWSRNCSATAALPACRRRAGWGRAPTLPLEQVLADPPQLVIAAGDERMEHHPALRGLRGVRYAELEPNLLFCGGPTIPRLAAKIAELRDMQS